MKPANDLRLNSNFQDVPIVHTSPSGRTKSLVINKLIKGIVVIFLVAMILFPAASFEGATSGLLLWFHNVLPTLLPFIIISNLMIRLNIASKISALFYPLLGKVFRISKEGCYPIIIGFLSGIPMGAKSTSDLTAQNKIQISEGNFLISMCNNASPMFIIGYIAISQLKLPRIKYPLFLIIYCSAIISALFCRYLLRNTKYMQAEATHTDSNNVTTPKEQIPNRFSFEILDSSIMNGFEVITKVGGYIILFSILAQIINQIGPNTGFYKAFLMGIAEITTGINQICKSTIDTNTKIVLVVVLTSFGGLSGMAQTKSVLGSTRLSLSYYVIAKLMNLLVTFLLALLYVNFVLL